MQLFCDGASILVSITALLLCIPHVPIMSIVLHVLSICLLMFCDSALLSIAFTCPTCQKSRNVNRIGGAKGVSNINSAYFIHIMPKIGGAKAPTAPPPPGSIPRPNYDPIPLPYNRPNEH